MAGMNITGQPDTGDYQLGRGIVYFGRLDATTGKPLEWRDVGNAPAFTLSIESEKLEHQSSRTGLKVTDKEVEISRKTNINVTLDEINHQNLAIFFSGSNSIFTNPAVAGFAEWTMVPAPGILRGNWYDITNSTGARAYDIDKTKLTVKNGTTNVALVENTDFLVDEPMGRVFILSTAPGIADGVTLKVTLTADAGAKGIDQMDMLTSSNSAVAIKFIEDNPANGGERCEVQLHKCTPKGEGDFNLISDEWTTMQISAVAESNSYFGASPYGWVRAIRAS